MGEDEQPGRSEFGMFLDTAAFYYPSSVATYIVQNQHSISFEAVVGMESSCNEVIFVTTFYLGFCVGDFLLSPWYLEVSTKNYTVDFG